MVTYIGIDPGKSGAIGFLYPDGQIKVFNFMDLNGLIELQTLSKDSDNVRACIEKVNAMPKQGVTSAFSFGDNFGVWKGRLEALNIKFELVTPQKWQKIVYKMQPNKIIIPKMNKNESNKKEVDRAKYQRKKAAKEFSLNYARRLFPKAKEYLARKMDSDRAEALLIAEYCRITHVTDKQVDNYDFLE